MQNSSVNSKFGVDLSQFNTVTSWEKLAKKVDFAFLRACTSRNGNFTRDAKFVEYAHAAAAVGIPTGAYHYCWPTKELHTARQQAEQFIFSIQQGFGRGNFGRLYPVLDVEQPIDKSMSTRELLLWVTTFKNHFEFLTKRELMLYTGLFFIDMYDDFAIHGIHPLKKMPLWIAMYKELPGNPEYPYDAGGWTRWTAWQYSETGSVDGVQTPVDLNYGDFYFEL